MLPNNPTAELVGIEESDTALAQRYAVKYHLSPKLFYTDVDRMLEEQHPDAVLVYTTIKDHRKIIEIAAHHGVSAMVEKPLATTMDDALAIRKAARTYHIHVLVNYETSWYASNQEAFSEIQQDKIGEIRKVIVNDGHQGPKEIGVGPEWLPWLTDPEQNGAGALFDFGCYGADLITVMMHGEAPLSVTAIVQTNKPDVYPRVDDDAVVILRYPKAREFLSPHGIGRSVAKTWKCMARLDMSLRSDQMIYSFVIRAKRLNQNNSASPRLRSQRFHRLSCRCTTRGHQV